MRGTRTPVVAFVVLVPVVVILAVIAFTNRSAAQEASRIGQLQPLGFAQLQSLPGGDAVLVEGRISDRMTPGLRSLVAYVGEQRHLDNDLMSVNWSEVERLTPPLRIELSDGEVRLLNSTYDIRNPLVSWLNTVEVSGPIRYSGFEVGSPVVVIGTLIRTGEGIKIAAEVVAGGTRSDYLAAQGGVTLLPVVLGGAALLVVASGIALVIAAYVLLFTLPAYSRPLRSCPACAPSTHGA